MAEIVSHHLRNVEVHHVDLDILDIGYLAADWPEAFVEGELARRLGALADRAAGRVLVLAPDSTARTVESGASTDGAHRSGCQSARPLTGPA